MNILMLTRERAGEDRFGLGKSLVPLMDGLRDAGHRVDYLTMEWLQRTEPRLLAAAHAAAGAQLAPLGLHPPELADLLTDIAAVGQAGARIALQRGYDLIHAHDVVIGSGLQAVFETAAEPTGPIRWGLTQHSFGATVDALHEQVMPLSPALRERLRAWERHLLGQAAWVLTPTRLGLERLAQDLGEAPIPTHWHALPHPRPRPRRYDRTLARERLGWAPATYRVIGVGMYLPVKRFERLIAACAPLWPDLRLTLIGAGDAEPLRRLAAQTGLGERLELACTDDIGLYLSAADLYVSTSASESFGVANLEAIVAGLPAIVSPAGAVPEVVGDAALLIEPEGPALGDAIARVRGDPALRERLSANALRRAAAWPTPTQVARRFVELTAPGCTTSPRPTPSPGTD